MSADRSAHCCLCGEPRRPTQAPLESFGNGVRIIQMDEHRPMNPGRWEVSPQMLVNVLMWRNGGTSPGQTHICDGCVLVGLQHAKQFVDQSIEALTRAARDAA
jgi:hypothetical protein